MASQPQTSSDEIAATQESSTFVTILFPPLSTVPSLETRKAPSCFRDLNLDQIVAAITKDWQEYDLPPFFQTPLHNLDAVVYRQEVMRDLEHGPVMLAIMRFSEAMRVMRARRARSEKSGYKQEKERWLLNAAVAYIDGVDLLLREMDAVDLSSQGLRRFRHFLSNYVTSAEYTTLVADAKTLIGDLSSIRYSVLLRGRGVTVRPYEDEPDYSVEVENTFEKFRRSAVKDYRVRFPEDNGLNHVEAQVLERVARLNPEVFGRLEAFCTGRTQFVHTTIGRFDREIQFYVSYLTYVEQFRKVGLALSYPDVSDASKEIGVENAFDLALAAKLVEHALPMARNGFSLTGDERICVVSGPNQGGKTTFARMFGQLHYLASLGCPVPGTSARLFLFDRIFTHFEREEDIKSLRGKLQDDLVRIHHILSEATPNSIVVMNEMFSSTTLHDGLFLSRRIMARLSSLDLLGVWVTFLTELATFDEKTVSMVSTVDPQDPAVRTYKVERRPANGLAYALALAEKHHVTHRWVQERIPA
jgi:DNA mismatch repair protein MutS